MAYLTDVRFIRTVRFLKDLKRIRATDAEVQAIEAAIASDPRAGDVVAGLGGARKLRFSLGGRGKRGGGRVVYVLFLGDDVAALLTAYAKSERSALSQDARREIRATIEGLTDDR